jgi:hypothetical protein
MAWGNKEKTFEEEFGMSRADFDQKMKEAKDAKDALETERTRISALEARGSELDTLKAELAALRAPSTAPTRTEPTNFFEDPDKAMNERLAPLAGVAMSTKASLEEMRARDNFRKDFTLWGKEINDLMAKEPDHLKANPVFWENAINMVRGRHAAEIEEGSRKGQNFFTEQPGGGTVGGSNDSPESKLTPEEVRAAQRLGMTPKEFLENQTYVLTQYGHTKGGTLVH